MHFGNVNYVLASHKNTRENIKERTWRETNINIYIFGKNVKAEMCEKGQVVDPPPSPLVDRWQS